MHAVQFNDRALSIAANGALLCVAAPGAGAQRAIANALEVPALVHTLRERWPATAENALWVALPPAADSLALGEALRQLRVAGYEVQGFVDAGAVLAGWLRLPGQTLVLDMTRHAVTVSLVVADDDANEGNANELRRTVTLPGGETRLYDLWLQLAAQTLVQQTRFDPLHDQRCEAQLRAHLPSLVSSAQRDGQARCSVDAGSQEFTLELARDQIAAAAEPWLQPIGAALQALAAGVGDCVVLVPEAIADIPGVEAALASAHLSTLYRYATGAPARAASLLPPSTANASGAVQYLTRVPRVPIASVDALQPLQLAGTASPAATHLIYRGRAVAIPAQGMVLGRDPGGGSAIELPEGLAGVSRRHCTLRYDGARALIVDHSAYGSFVDGMRVRGRALLSAGSTLRLGNPGIELQLVALESAANSRA
jgi:FHA domain